MISLICFGCGHSRRGTGKQWHRRQNSEERIMKAQLRAMPSATLCTMVFPSTSQGRSNGGLFLSVSYVHMYRSCKIKMRCFCDSKMKMDQGFFQVSSFPLTIQSPRHMLQKRGPCLARHTSTSAGGSPAARVGKYKIYTYKLASPRTEFFLASICHANTDPPGRENPAMGYLGCCRG